MTSRRNILVLITPGFASSEADSSCLPLQQALVGAWLRMAPQFEVHVLALHYPFQRKNYTLQGAQVHAFGGGNRGGIARWKRKWEALRTLEKLRSSCNVVGMVSCWYGEAADIGSAFSRQHSIPHYCWLLGQDARSANHWPQRLRLPGSALVALSQSLEEECAAAHGVRPEHIILPGLTQGSIQSPGERPCLLLGVGSLIPLKRWTVFIQVLAALRKEYPALQAVLLGEGPELAALQRQAAESGVQDVLRFVGSVPHIKVLHWMRQARVLLHPSEYEGYSGVCQEALSQGTPVVSFRTPGGKLPEGWWQAYSVAEMTERVAHLLGEPEGVKPVSFPIEHTARQWLALFGIQVEESAARNPRAMAPGEKFS